MNTKNKNKKTKAIDKAVAAVLVLSLLTVGFTVTSAQMSETEPNNEFGDANLVPLATPVTATIYPAGDYDWFKVVVTKTGVLTASVTNVPASMRANIELYGANNNHLGGTTGSAGADTEYSYDLSPGWYYFRIRDYAGKRYTDPYTLNVTLAEIPDAYEPNGDFASAKEIGLGTAVKPYIFGAGDYDWFKVNLTKTGVLKIAVTNLPSAYMRANIELYGVNNNHIAGTTGSAGANTTLSRDLGPGRYYFRIRDYAGKRYTDPYTLTVTQDEVPDAYEPNHDFAHASLLTTAGTFNAYTFPSGDNDYFKFNVSSSGTLTVGVSDIPTPYIRMRIRIYNKNLEHLATATASAGSAVSLSKDISPGMHYLQIDDAAGKRATDPYTLTISGVTVTTPPPLPAPVTTEDEPNNGFGDANVVSLGTTVTGDFYYKYDYDWFRVKAEKSGVLNVSVTQVPSGIDAHINLYDANGKWLGRVTGSVGSPVSLYWDVTPDWYFIRIDDYYDQSTDDYKFIVTLAEADDENEPNNELSQAAELALENAVTGYFFPRYDYDWFKVKISTPGVLNVSVTEVPTYLRAHVNLYGANVNWLAGVTSEEGTPVTLYYDAIPDTYYFYIDDYYARSADPYGFSVLVDEAPDAYEPNDDFAHAAPLTEAETNAYIFKSRDNDWFKTYVSSTGTISAEVTEIPTVYMQMRVEIYDKSNKFLAGATATSPGEPVSVSYNATTTGTYYFRIYDTKNLRSTTPYTVCFSGIDLVESIPPAIYNLKPADGGVATDSTPEISANYDDIGTGIDTTTVKLYVDGAEVTASATVSASQVTYTPTTALADGKHTAAVSVKDRAGNHALETWHFTVVATQPTALISLEKTETEYSPGETMNLTLRVLNPTETPRDLYLLWYLNLDGGWTPVTTIPVTLSPGFDEEYFVPYTVQNWGASSLAGLWLVALLDAKTGALLNYDYVAWTYVPAKTSAEGSSETENASEIAAGLKRAIEKEEAEMPKSLSVTSTATPSIDIKQILEE
ncbi:MAG: Ig-like domain-containing protein [Methanophagales archaeon]|nr:Ig-like domain-containing protein [Methanophagales archaeon]